MCRMYSDFAFCCRYIGIANLHLANEYTGGADLVIRDELFGEFPLAFCDVAVPTTADGIRVVVRDGFALLAGIEPKDTFCVALQGLITKAHCLVMGCFRIL